MQHKLFEQPRVQVAASPGQLARQDAARERRVLRTRRAADAEARRAEIAIVASSLILASHARRALQVLEPRHVGDPLWRVVYEIVGVCRRADVTPTMPLLLAGLRAEGVLLIDGGAWIVECACSAWLQRDEIDIERYAALVRNAHAQRLDLGPFGPEEV